MRDAGDVEDGIQVFQRIEAGMVAEWAFGAEFVEIDVALEHDFAAGRDFQIDRLALDQLDRRSAEKARDHVLLDLGRGRNDRRKCNGRIGADRDRDFHFAGRTVAFGEDASAGTARHDVDRGRFSFDRSAHAFAGVFRGHFLALPMHSGGALVVHLHAIHAEIALARLRIARGHAGQSDEASSIFRPALQDRKVEQRKLSRLITSLQGPVGTVRGKNFPASVSSGSIFSLSRNPCGDFMSMNMRMRAAISSYELTPTAIFMRASEPN